MSETSIDIDVLQRLAALDLPEEEGQELRASLTKILNAFEALQEVETDGVEPLYNINEAQSSLREDQADQLLTRDEVLRSAPLVSNDSYKLRRMLVKSGEK